jgi:hypothetical protein
MGNPFDAALDTLFTSAIGEDVTYTDSNSVATTVRAMATLPDVITPLAQSRVRQEVCLFEIRVEDVATSAPGHTITRSDGSVFRVMSVRRHDARRTIWLIECALVTEASLLGQLDFSDPRQSGESTL